MFPAYIDSASSESDNLAWVIIGCVVGGCVTISTGVIVVCLCGLTGRGHGDKVAVKDFPPQSVRVVPGDQKTATKYVNIYT